MGGTIGMPSVRKRRILYWYSSNHVNTGSPKVLISMVELINRSRFQAVYLASSNGPLPKVLSMLGVEIIYGSVRSVDSIRPLRSINAYKIVHQCTGFCVTLPAETKGIDVA